MRPFSTDGWRQIEALLDAALDVPEGQRAAFLQQACAGDTQLLDEVMQVLDAGAGQSEILDRSAADFASALLARVTPDPAPRREAPQRIGPYRIVHEIGRGGMGSVYLAERDVHFSQRVALKLLRADLHGDALLMRRFAEERQILASLEHANIARVLDGGVTDDGVPWFAMEFVEGKPVDEWCDERRLPLDARLNLFCTICSAVGYAHERRIIHRDIKPSNVLVRADGTVKLLDFGVAKLIDHERQDQATTRVGSRLLTPEYASPEQLRGLTTTPTSDVYSLGVLLYELLAGCRPSDTAAERETREAAALDRSPLPPSVAVQRRAERSGANTLPPIAQARSTTMQELAARLRGDLDTIVVRALEQDPGQRYSSVQALALDLQRHNAGLPVRRTRRLARRFAMVLAALTALVLAAGAAARFYFRPAVGPSSDIPLIAIGRMVDHRGAAESDLANPLAELLATNLARVPSLRTLSTARLYELMVGSADDADSNPGVYSAAARRAGAGMLLEGSLYAVGSDELRLDLRRIDVGSGGVLSSASINGRDIFTLVDAATAWLASDIGAGAPPGSVADVTTRSVVAHRLYVEGLRAHYRGERIAAERLFASALREDSSFAMAAYYYAISPPISRTEAAERLNRAVRLAQRATERERLIIHGMAAYLNASPSLHAIADSLVTRYPDEYDGHFYLGIAYRVQGDWAAARSELRRAISAESDRPVDAGIFCRACMAYSQIVGVYQLMDSMDAALPIIEEWQKRYPDDPVAWLAAGRVFAQLGNAEAAIDAYMHTARLMPTGSDLLNHRAFSWLQSDRHDLADPILRAQTEAARPEYHTRSSLLWTMSLRQQGRFREALVAAREYRRIAAGETQRGGPGSAPPEARIEAQILAEMGNGPRAQALFDSIARWRSPDEPHTAIAHERSVTLALLAPLLAASHDMVRLASVIPELQHSAREEPALRERLLHHFARGLLLESRGELRAAETSFRTALFSPSHGYTQINLALARVLLRLDQPRDAVAVLQAILRSQFEGAAMYVSRTEAHEQLARAWDEVGAADSALVHWAIVVRSWNAADAVLADRVRHARTRVDQLRIAPR